MSRHPAALALLAALLFGAATPASKWVLGTLPPFQLAGLLYWGAALGVLPLLRRGQARALPRAPRTRLLLAGAILFGGVLGPVLLLLGLQRAASGDVALWLNLEGVATALLGVLLFRDHLTRRSWLAVAGTLAAATLLSWGGGAAEARAGLLVAGACVAWGLDNHLTALIDGISPAQTTLWKGVVAGSVNVALGLLLDPFRAGLWVTLGALAIGIFAYGLSLVLYISAAQQLGATRSQLLFSTAPLFGLALAVGLLGEPLRPVQLGAAALFAASLLLLLRDDHAHPHTHWAMAHTHRHPYDPAHGHDHHPAAAPDHTHPHEHEPVTHSHGHLPDLHHRHDHE